MSILLLLVSTLLVQLPGTRQAQMGVATGQISNLEGKPAPGIRVSAMSVPDPKDPAGGGGLLSLAETDAEGKFRLENIPPGRYYIQAGLLEFPTYYPGVTTLESAKAVSIEAGVTTEGLDFKMPRPPGVRISGRVPKNLTPQPRMAMLMPTAGSVTTNNSTGSYSISFNGATTVVRMAGGGFSMMGMPQQATLGADGTFEFVRVKPGNYMLMLAPSTGLSRNIVVDDKDIDLDLGAPAGPGFKVSGVVGANSTFPGIPNQRVVLSGWMQMETTIDASGRVECPNVPDGTYSVHTIPGSRSPAATITVRGQDVSGITLPGSVEVNGVVIVEDPTGAATSTYFSTASTTLVATSLNGSTVYTQIGRGGLTVYSNGSAGSGFTATLYEKEYRVSVENLPSGLSLRALTYGTVDLLKEPLKLDGSSRPQQIRVTLVKEP